MTNRYTITTPFSDAYHQSYGPFIIQHADIRDTRTGHTYQDGAYRVLDSRTDKPARRGKGGTHPFYGERAWSDAERLAGDLFYAERMAGLS